MQASAFTRFLLVLCCAVTLIDTVFFAALAPLIPYYKQTFGFSTFGVGVLNGAYGAGILAGTAPAAWLAVHAGVQRTAVLGLVILALTSFLFGLADDGRNLILLRFGAGFGSACSWLAVFTWIVSVTSGQRRGQLIGTLISAAVVGALIGPMLGSAAARFGMAPVFSLVALLALGIATGLTLQPRPSHIRRWSWRELWMLGRPRPIAGLSLIVVSPLLASTLVVLAPLELSRFGWGATRIGLVFLLGAVFESVLHPLAGRWSDRSGYRAPLATGLGISALLLMALPLASDAWTYSALVILAAGLFNLALTPGTALFSQSFDQLGGSQALGFAMTNVAWAGGFTVGTPLVGWLSDLGGAFLAYVPLAALCCLGLFVLRRLI